MKRGISEEVATVLIENFNSLGEIASAGIEGLDAVGIESEVAEKVLASLGNTARKSKKATVKAAPEAPAEEEAPQAPTEEYTGKQHVNTETEQKLFDIAEKNGVELPKKVVFDIAERIDKAADQSIFDDATCEKLIVRAGEMYDSHKMCQNESAGVMAAHSIGEPGTQMNLRTFHFAGDSFVSVTKGLPRLIEIVDARREPSTPSMTVPLLGLAKEDEGLAKRIASDIEITTLANVAEIETDVTNLVLYIKPIPELLKDKGIEFDDVVDRLSKIKALKGQVQAEDFRIKVSSSEPSFKKLQQMSDAVRNAKIKGIDGINQAFIKREKDGTFTIITDGSNLKEILKVEMVDAANVMTNSICEIADVLGIEAARNAIVREAYSTLEEAGLNVDIRHIMMVADLMTNDGTVRAIGRHGVSGKKSSVLARAAFEITTAHLLHAAIIGETDGLEGVTENIIVGQPVTLGTGAVNLQYTPKKKGDNE